MTVAKPAIIGLSLLILFVIVTAHCGQKLFYKETECP